MNNGGATTQPAEGMYPLSLTHTHTPSPLILFGMLIILAADLSLADILTPANLLPLFNDHPDLVPTLFPHLPPDLPVPPSEQVLQRIIQ
jgi:hypothetical protein